MRKEIKKYMAKHKITICEFARRAGVPRESIRRILNNPKAGLLYDNTIKVKALLTLNK